MKSNLSFSITAGMLVKDGRMSRAADTINWLSTIGMAGLAIKMLRSMWGGLWVGGLLSLRQGKLEFEPTLNSRQWTSGTLSVTIPLASIDRVDWRPGMRTGILDVTWRESGASTCSFRCDDSRKIAEIIREAVQGTTVTGIAE